MGEFEEKVGQFKQTVQEPGFVTGDENDSPTIGGQSMDDGGDIDAAPAPQEARPQRRERKKHTNTYKKRIDQLAYENRIKDQQLAELTDRARQQEYLLSQQSAALENEKDYKNAYYENNLQTREASIINELKAAKEEGDVDKEIALSKALSQVTAEQATYGLYKNQLEQRVPAPNFDPDPIETHIYPAPHIAGPDYDDYDDQGDEISEVAEEWLDSNPWANPRDRSYSPKLRSELDTLAAELNETLRYNGHADMIGTPEYFSSLDNLMADRYSINAPQQEPRRYNNSPSVAPVSRRGSSMADQYISNNPNSTRRSMPLSEDEYKIARNLQIKGPNGQWVAAGDIGVKRYYENKRAMGGNSNKLVIE